MSAKLPEPKKFLAEVIRENWSEQLELGGSKSGYVACYAANQVLGTVWRSSKEDSDTKEIRDRAALRRVSAAFASERASQQAKLRHHDCWQRAFMSPRPSRVSI